MTWKFYKTTVFENVCRFHGLFPFYLLFGFYLLFTYFLLYLKERLSKTNVFCIILIFFLKHSWEKHEIKETLEYGVGKMNIDTDTQYSFSRPVVDHVLKNYDGLLKIDGEVGNKKVYDPRSYLKKAEEAMAARMVEACNDLESNGKTIFGNV